MADDTRDAPQQKIELEIRPPVRLESLRDDLPLESLWQQRQAERDDAEWEALGGTPIQGEQGLEEAAKSGKEVEAGERVPRRTEKRGAGSSKPSSACSVRPKARCRRPSPRARASRTCARGQCARPSIPCSGHSRGLWSTACSRPLSAGRCPRKCA